MTSQFATLAAPLGAVVTAGGSLVWLTSQLQQLHVGQTKLEGRIDLKFADVARQLDKLDAKLDGKLDRLDAKLDGKLDAKLALVTGTIMMMGGIYLSRT
jgi:hypothetical protein